MLDLEKLLMETLYSLDYTVNVHLHNDKRKYKNCISPSQINLVKDSKKQAWYFFDPEILFDLGIIDDKFRTTATKRKILDDSGYVNTTLGTLIHAALLYPMEANAKKQGYDLRVEFPVYSHKYASYGTCDMVLFNEESKSISIFDLKTTSADKIVTRDTECRTSYQLQLFTYAMCFLDRYPDYGIDRLGILSLCKDPNPKIPCVAYMEFDIEELYNKHNKFILDTASQVVSLNEIMRDNNKPYAKWLLDNTEPECYKGDCK